MIVLAHVGFVIHVDCSLEMNNGIIISVIRLQSYTKSLETHLSKDVQCQNTGCPRCLQENKLLEESVHLITALVFLMLAMCTTQLESKALMF